MERFLHGLLCFLCRRSAERREEAAPPGEAAGRRQTGELLLQNVDFQQCPVFKQDAPVDRYTKPHSLTDQRTLLRLSLLQICA